MIILYILGALLLLLVIFLTINIKFYISIDENFDYVLKFGFIRILSSKKKKATTSKIPKRKSDNGFIYFKKLKQEKGLGVAVCELSTYVKLIFSELGFLISQITIKDFICRVKVAESDAASTAIMYGVVSASVYSLAGFLHSIMKFDIKEISVKEDYDSSDGDLKLSFSVKIRLLFLIIFAFKILIKIINKRDVLSWEKTALKV